MSRIQMYTVQDKIMKKQKKLGRPHETDFPIYTTGEEKSWEAKEKVDTVTDNLCPTLQVQKKEENNKNITSMLCNDGAKIVF